MASRAGIIGASLMSVSFATSAIATIGSLNTAFGSIACTLFTILPPIAMVLVIMAAVIYAAGQVGGAEFRANASKWATALIVGAVLALVLVLLLPGILNALMPSTVFTTGACA